MSSHYLAQIEADRSFAGIVGLVGSDEVTPLWPEGFSEEESLSARAKKALSKEYVDATSFEYRYSMRVPGDRAEIVRTELVRARPFPVFSDEKFLSETYLWQGLSNAGLKFRWVNSITYCAKYLEDGLTKNNGLVWAKSPNGAAFTKNFDLRSRVPLSHKPRAAVGYIRYGIAAGKNIGRLFYECNSKLLFLAALPIAVVFPIKPN